MHPKRRIYKITLSDYKKIKGSQTCQHQMNYMSERKRIHIPHIADMSNFVTDTLNISKLETAYKLC